MFDFPSTQLFSMDTQMSHTFTIAVTDICTVTVRGGREHLVKNEQVKFLQVHLLLFTSVIINVSSYTRCYSAYSILKNPFHIWSTPIECQCISPNKELTQQQTCNHFTGWLRNRIKEKNLSSHVMIITDSTDRKSVHCSQGASSVCS